jgi:Zn-dependent alcohol dehydrogenase
VRQCCGPSAPGARTRKAGLTVEVELDGPQAGEVLLAVRRPGCVIRLSASGVARAAHLPMILGHGRWAMCSRLVPA